MERAATVVDGDTHAAVVVEENTDIRVFLFLRMIRTVALGLMVPPRRRYGIAALLVDRNR